MECSEEDLLKLIGIYKTKALLWDPKHRDHFKKNLKKDAWREIGAEMNTCPEKCKKKMICLLASYRREKTKVRRSRETGKGTDDIYVSRWYAYEAFAFLEDRDLPRKELNTEIDAAPSIADDTKEEVMRAEQREQDASQRTQQTTASPSTRPATKRAKGKRDNASLSMMNSAFDILKTAVSDKKPSRDDEIEAFFTYVAAKARKYSPEAQRRVQHAVFEILTKADRGLFD